MRDSTLPKITVVTPNYNQAAFLEQAICSVINQQYPNLEYIIIDGGSTDASVEIIKKYQDNIHYWISEKDKGMYDAINKGFSRSTGKIMCWINSDDVLWDGALMYVGNLLSLNPDIKWLQGWPTVIDEEGKIIFQRKPVYSRFYFYLKRYERTFSFIQQESTFWTRETWEKAGGVINREYTIAGDFDLWMRFFRTEKLYCTKVRLAAFRKRKGQQSGNADLYLKEAALSVADNRKKLPLRHLFLLWMLKKLEKIIYQLKNRRLLAFYNKCFSAVYDNPKFV